MSAIRAAAALGLVFLASCAGGCPGRQSSLPVVQGADGRQYRVLDKGLYKAWYSLEGQLQRIEYDRDGDGRPEQVDLHGGSARPTETRVDANSDGRFERIEHYDSAGRLVRVDLAGSDGKPELGVVFDAAGDVARKEHDVDRDGRPERVELFVERRLARVELDGDRDGRVDRWQEWRAGALVNEDLDTDADGQRDRRLSYGPGGAIEVQAVPVP